MIWMAKNGMLLDKFGSYEKKYKQALVIEAQIVSSLDRINTLIDKIAKASNEQIILLEEQLEEEMFCAKDLLAKFEVIDLAIDEGGARNSSLYLSQKQLDSFTKKMAEYHKYDVWKKERTQSLSSEFIKSQSLANQQALHGVDHTGSNRDLWEKELEKILMHNKQLLEFIKKANLVLEEMYSCPFGSIMRLKEQRINYLLAAEHILEQLKTIELNYHA